MFSALTPGGYSSQSYYSSIIDMANVYKLQVQCNLTHKAPMRIELRGTCELYVAVDAIPVSRCRCSHVVLSQTVQEPALRTSEK